MREPGRSKHDNGITIQQIAAGMIIGAGIGVALGVTMDDTAVGLAIGIAIGVVFALAWSSRSHRTND